MCFGDRQRNNVRFRKLRALSRDLPIHREMALRAVLVASYESVYPLISHISQYVDYMESFQVLRLSASCDLAMSREMCRFVVLYMCSICFNCAFLIYYIIMVLFLQWKYKKLLWSLSCNSKTVRTAVKFRSQQISLKSDVSETFACHVQVDVMT